MGIDGLVKSPSVPLGAGLRFTLVVARLATLPEGPKTFRQCPAHNSKEFLRLRLFKIDHKGEPQICQHVPSLATFTFAKS
jgi:hypothetical protein